MDVAPGTPGWWLQKLTEQLDLRAQGRSWRTLKWNRKGRPPLRLLEAHLRGDPPLPLAAARWQDGMREFLRMARMNYAELINDSLVERMLPVGFRTAADADRNGDQEAARMFRANRLGVVLPDIFGDMVGYGDGYAIIGSPDPETDIARITAGNPFDTITYDDPFTARPKIGLNRTIDEWTGEYTAHLYLPGMVLVADLKAGLPISEAKWDDERSGELPAEFRTITPLAHFQNLRGRGECEPHLDVIDRINHGIFQRVVVAALQAFKQRAVIGLPGRKGDVAGHENDPDAEDPIDYTGVFSADPAALWQLPAGASMWESGAIDLGPIRQGVKDDVEGLAAATGSPLFYLFPDAANGSAEGATSQKERHLYKVEDRRRRADGALPWMLSTAFLFQGDKARADASQISTIWQPAERYSLTARYSAAAQAVGVEPLGSIWQNVLQYTPDEIAWMESLQLADQARAALLAATAPAPAPDAGGAQPAEGESQTDPATAAAS